MPVVVQSFSSFSIVRDNVNYVITDQTEALKIQLTQDLIDELRRLNR